ncbi:Uncharacterized protein HZ326_22818 [Fusarium oxysporum f. sp. albedinis]|nr:Uncharacterized protein HZ326_22818 [Fusarium oxysporum f. sp. albedinis]
MKDNRGNRTAPTSLHQAIGSTLYAMLSTGGSDKYWSSSSCTGNVADCLCLQGTIALSSRNSTASYLMSHVLVLLFPNSR